MLNSGPSGFYNAPVSKGILIGTVASSILVSVAQLGKALTFHDLSSVISKFQLWRLFTNHMFFTSPGEVLFGSILIYYFRMLERQMGSVKFAGFAFVSIIFATLMQIPLFVLFYTTKGVAAGPYSLIFSCLVQFYFDIPATYRFRVFGITSNDKLFAYLLSIQLMFSNYPGSVLAAFCGILSGLAYRSDALKLSKFKFPGVINNFFTRFILPMLQSSSRGSPHNPISINPSGAPPRNTPAPPPGGPSQGFSDQLIPNYPVFGAPQRFTVPPVVHAPPSEDSIQALTSMGFSRDASVQALQRTNNDLQLATNILLDGVL